MICGGHWGLGVLFGVQLGDWDGCEWLFVCFVWGVHLVDLSVGVDELRQDVRLKSGSRQKSFVDVEAHSSKRTSLSRRPGNSPSPLRRCCAAKQQLPFDTNRKTEFLKG